MDIGVKFGTVHFFPEKAPTAGASAEPKPSYDLQEAKESLAVDFERVNQTIRGLTEGACPDGFAVIQAIIHPERPTRDYHPKDLMSLLGLSRLGSRRLKIRPRRYFHHPSDQAGKSGLNGVAVFLAGQKNVLASAAETLNSIRPGTPEATQIAALESVKCPDPIEKIRFVGDTGEDVFEVALNLFPRADSPDFPFDRFSAYAESVGFKVPDKHRLRIGEMLFVPVRGPRAGLTRLAEFSFVRQIRDISTRLNLTRPMPVEGEVGALAPPASGPLSTIDYPKVALLDGGLPSEHLFKEWVLGYFKADPKDSDMSGVPEHGHAVLMAFLLGPLSSGEKLPTPVCPVTCFRVFDAGILQEDPLRLYRTIGMIEPIIESGKFEFVNISLGPGFSVQDGMLHSWTALLDKLLASGNVFLTVAVGNIGQTSSSRIEVPADCVNALSV